ncbi:MAG: tRNA (adenosine(37)-N6)-dimethylallyltransferase MiaA, partial [Enterobacterales bacterium]|nr:tRNA (adenosine(37)-N6)-dimethylallyltransferase MiaA [Enterobacterales bacterium]
MTYNLIAIIGATASGKTQTAVKVANTIGGEIISADSRQVYRGMDLGTGKDLDEYGATPYHLIDICDPGDSYDLYRFQQDVYCTFQALQQRNKLAILCGGSSMYISAIINQYDLHAAPMDETLRDKLKTLSLDELQKYLLNIDSTQHNSTDMLDENRLIRAIEIAEATAADTQTVTHPELTPLVIAIMWPREERRARIKQRLQERLDAGMVAEVEALYDAGISWEKLEYFGLEYRFIAQYLQKKLSYNDMFQKLSTAIAKFAKKQDTWLRKLERDGTKIHWVEGGKDQINATL